MRKPRSTARLSVETITYRCTVGRRSLPDLRRDFERFIVQHALERLDGSLIRTSEALQITRVGLRFIIERLNIPEPGGSPPTTPPDEPPENLENSTSRSAEEPHLSEGGNKPSPTEGEAMEPFTTLSSGYYAGWQLRGTLSDEERRQLAQELEDNPETVAELVHGIRRGLLAERREGQVER